MHAVLEMETMCSCFFYRTMMTMKASVSQLSFSTWT